MKSQRSPGEGATLGEVAYGRGDGRGADNGVQTVIYTTHIIKRRQMPKILKLTQASEK
jgi:hypothetical protein